MDADEIGIKNGATTIIDAGSAGPETIDLFRKNVVETHLTNVYAFLNISKKGLAELSELNSLEKIDLDLVGEKVKDNQDIIVGLKARASASVVGDLGITPIRMAIETAEKLNQKIMVHTGNFPPYLQEVLALMRKEIY